MFRLMEKEWYTGEYYDYIKAQISEYDESEQYYEDDITIYKNKPYKANKTTPPIDDVDKSFRPDDWDKQTEDEAYYDDVPIYFRYKPYSTRNKREDLIQGLTGNTVVKGFETTSDIEFKTNDKVLLQQNEIQLKISEVNYTEDTRNSLAAFQFANMNPYINKVITLQ